MSPEAEALAELLRSPGLVLPADEVLAVHYLSGRLRERDTTTRGAVRELQALGRLVIEAEGAGARWRVQS
ncbi:hypothetical protein L6R49_28150 [Myxococcota bacterium]|nr:hypothetical protein [Myxococcota bacterium]